MQNLTDLGLSFNQNGQLSFDQTQFANVANTNPNDVAAFLGTSSGSGFLNAASNILNGLDDPTNGLFQSAKARITQQINTDNSRSQTRKTRSRRCKTKWWPKWQRRTRMIASLQSQVTYFTSLFTDTQSAITNG